MPVQAGTETHPVSCAKDIGALSRGVRQLELGFDYTFPSISWVRSRSQWLRGLRRRSAAARLLIVGSNPTGGMDVCQL